MTPKLEETAYPKESILNWKTLIYLYQTGLKCIVVVVVVCYLLFVCFCFSVGVVPAYEQG